MSAKQLSEKIQENIKERIKKESLNDILENRLSGSPIKETTIKNDTVYKLLSNLETLTIENFAGKNIDNKTLIKHKSQISNQLSSLITSAIKDHINTLLPSIIDELTNEIYKEIKTLVAIQSANTTVSSSKTSKGKNKN